MAETKTQIIEREYTIPLRRVWLRVPQYKRTGKAVKAIKEFIAKHMKVPDRDVSKVKLDIYFNNELWFRGKTNPPAKVKVKVRKEGDIVRVEFAEVPEYVKFLKAKHSRLHKKEEKKAEKQGEKKEEIKPEETKEEKAEERKNEVEKEKSVEQANIKLAEQAARAEKHLTPKKEPRIRRMALKK